MSKEHNNDQCEVPFCDKCLANIKRVAEQGRRQLGEVLAPQPPSAKPDDGEVEGTIDNLINAIWAVVKKDSLASSRIGRPAAYTRVGIRQLIATQRQQDCEKVLEAINNLEIDEGEVLQFKPNSRSEFKRKRIVWTDKLNKAVREIYR